MYRTKNKLAKERLYNILHKNIYIYRFWKDRETKTTKLNQLKIIIMIFLTRKNN